MATYPGNALTVVVVYRANKRVYAFTHVEVINDVPGSANFEESISQAVKSLIAGFDKSETMISLSHSLTPLPS